MSENSRFLIESITFDAASGELSVPAAARRLEPRAAAVLTILCSRRGEVVTRQDLLDRCWGNGEGSDEALTQAVSQIRRALQDLGSKAGLLETLAKRGYRLNTEKANFTLGKERNSPYRKPSNSLLIGGIVTVALIAAVIAFPHQLRHNLRHAFGLGPTADGAANH